MMPEGSENDMPPAAPILLTDQVSRAFHGKPAVSDLSIAVRPGRIMGLLGPRGWQKHHLTHDVRPPAAHQRSDPLP